MPDKLNSKFKAQLFNRKYWFTVLSLIALILIGFYLFNRYFGPTRVALVNYQAFQAAKFAQAEQTGWVAIEQLKPEAFSDLDDYDFILIFGRGLKLTALQLDKIKQVSKSNYVLVDSAMNPAHNINSIPEAHKTIVSQYLNHAGLKNYKNLLRYFRTKIQPKYLSIVEPDEPLIIGEDSFFHLSPEAIFSELNEYLTYYEQQNSFHPSGKKIALLTSVPGPFNSNREHIDALIKRLEQEGYQVYPIASRHRRLQFLQQIKPDAVVFMPHGRLHARGAKQAIQWLKEKNIPVLSPLSVFKEHANWLNDPQGFSGSLLSMNVVLPELDGAIAPYVINAQFPSESGYTIFNIIPERLEKFVDLLNGFLALKSGTNQHKKIAIVYFRGPGKNALVAGNMEVSRSLFNTLHRLKSEAYDLSGLPDDFTEFEQQLNQQGVVMTPKGKGLSQAFVKSDYPAFILSDTYRQWCESLAYTLCEQIEKQYGTAPGSFLVDDSKGIAVARLQYGNVAILPQPLPGFGDNTFQLVHGTDKAPPHTYAAAYLWLRHAFSADAVIHFGTHGSLEFTPKKQIALSQKDWADALLGAIPHFYIYTMSNVGEAIIAKRRSYATILNHLTPPFTVAGLQSELKQLSDQINEYPLSQGSVQAQLRLDIIERIKAISIDKALNLSQSDLERVDSWQQRIYSPVSQWLETLALENITEGLYTLGQSYSEEQVSNTIQQMFSDTLRHLYTAMQELSLKLNIESGMSDVSKESGIVINWIEQRLAGQSTQTILRASFDPDLIKTIQSWRQSGWQSGKAKVNHGHGGGNNAPSIMKSHDDTNQNNNMLYEELDLNFDSISKLLDKIPETVIYLKTASELEQNALLNALKGGYVEPASGGDPIVNPLALPTGRNMFAIDAEKTPSESAWKVGMELANSLLAEHQQNHGELPKKVAFTLWPSSFIHSKGATIAEILYLLGVEPVRDPFGRIQSLRLIPEEQLKRPRIDVVVQSAGQLRDLAASRLKLIEDAVKMAAEADDKDENYVAQGVRKAEKYLLDKGVPPLSAKKLSIRRSFGGVNNQYGTAIMGLVESSHKWQGQQFIAKQYIKNMGAVYGEEGSWGEFHEHLFAAALLDTDIIVQPRSSNTWGALSLDHVYEFMGGLNAAVNRVTGQTPEAYFNDYRNSAKAKVATIDQTIWLEAQSTLFNPNYIKALTKGGASSAETFAETFRNTFGWSAMRPEAIAPALWEELYQTYIEDKHQLELSEFFKAINPYALQDMTGVLLEASRKGFWIPDASQLKALAQLHADLVSQFEAGCGNFTCGNPELKVYIVSQLDNTVSETYQLAINSAEGIETGTKSIVLVETKKQTDSKQNESSNASEEAIKQTQETRQSKEENRLENQKTSLLQNLWFSLVVIIIVILIVSFWNKHRDNV